MLPAAAASSGPIAIIGIGCRLPDAEDPERYFANLAAGHDAVRRGTGDGGPDARGFVRAFGAIDGIEDFDAGLFRLIPRHAELLCPEQRLLLECAWSALESAGYAPDAAPGSVGVFVAAGRSSYRQGPLRTEAERLVAEAALGQDYGATRISHKLNLRGPSLSVQTASSASLVAVHMACEALLAGQCDMALAGGASVALPQDGYRHDPSLMFAADGRCRAFDAAASGTVPGNGAALVLLKPLAAALAEGDPVVAVIRAGAVNNDGAGKVDFYAPSQDGQAAVLREALAMAGLSPGEIGYVEAHGTGTPLGDPIEIAALADVFAGAAPGSVAIGSVKSGIGHLHCAAGVAGLVKAALMLRHRLLVPSLHFNAPNPRSLLAAAGSPFAVCTETRPWPGPPVGGPRRAGVSSFGIGGTNAHVVLEEPPEPPGARATEAAGTWHLFPLSARTPEALAAMRARLATHVEAHPELELRDIAATLQQGRATFAHRAALVAADRATLLTALRGEAVAEIPAAPAPILAAARVFAAGAAFDRAAVAPADARRVALPTYPFERRRHWIEQTPEQASPPAIAAGPSAAVPADLLPTLRATAGRVLGLPAEAVGIETGLAELGVESIVTPLLAAELSAATGRAVAPEDLYNHPTLAQLAAALARRAPEPAAAPPSVTLPVARMEEEDDAIAVIGMAGRFTGAPDLDAFWRLIAEGRTAVAPLPEGLWGNTPTAGHIGGLLPDFDCFDAAFFGISPREALLMDPQQRVFLEECWRALEDAGLTAEAALAGRRVGVFAGAQATDWSAAATAAASHGTIGASLAILAARVAYALDLKGPALTVDTACSAALAALHLAAQSLRAGECEVALAGGVSVSLYAPRGHAFFAEAGLLSARGACRPFAPDADGIVPADGVGVVVLKRLADARRDGDTVRGVILASALNQDGRTNGITAPNGPSQTALVVELYRRRGIDPATIGYVEAHGTGTRLGDPIEIAALAEAFRDAARNGDAGLSCAVGSVKANIGHALPAAGIAGLLKALLALEAGRLPPSLPQAGPGAPERVAFPGTPFFAPGRLLDWSEPLAGRRRRAAVSAFGFGGTNAHVVLEAAAEPPRAAAAAPPAEGWPILL